MSFMHYAICYGYGLGLTSRSVRVLSELDYSRANKVKNAVLLIAAVIGLEGYLIKSSAWSLQQI